jgi:hypothetical protein
MKYITCILAFALVACGMPVTSVVNPPETAKPAGPVVLIVNTATGAKCSAVVVDDLTLLTSRLCIDHINLISGKFDVWTSLPGLDDIALTNEPELGILPDRAPPVAASWADTYVASSVYDIAIVPLLRPLPAGSMHASLSYVPIKFFDDVSVVSWGCAGEARSYAAKVLGAVVPDGTMPVAMNDDAHNIGVILPTAGKCQNDLGAGVFDANGNVVGIVSSYPIVTKTINITDMITVTMLGAIVADMQAQLAMHAASSSSIVTP